MRWAHITKVKKARYFLLCILHCDTNINLNCFQGLNLFFSPQQYEYFKIEGFSPVENISMQGKGFEHQFLVNKYYHIMYTTI